MARSRKIKPFALPAPGQMMRHPHLLKLRRDIIDSIRKSGVAAVDAMRERVLNSPPTGSPYDDGQRIDTGLMFESIERGKTVIQPGLDRRYRQTAIASFGFPAGPHGGIGDAPGRTPGARGWSEDSDYFARQEYGKDDYDVSYPGMYAQNAGRKAFMEEFDREMSRLKRKYEK